MTIGVTSAATCTKVRFATRRAAKIALRRQPVCKRFYTCPVCGWIHLSKYSAAEYARRFEEVA